MAPRIPHLPDRRAFESAARHGSLRLAAQELNVTHSAVSHQITFLQETPSVAPVCSVLAHDDIAAGRLCVLSVPRLPSAFAYYVV